MRLARGVRGHETLVWCDTMDKNDMILHLHTPWWKPRSNTSIWVHRKSDADSVIALAAPYESWDELIKCETWMEAAALLRPLA